MRRYLIYTVAALSFFLGSINSTSVAVAFPSIISDFNVSLVLAGWVLSIYSLVMVVAIPIFGKMSDVFGRRSTFIICLLLFTVGSALCAIAPNIEWLLFFRVLQAAGAGGFIPAGTGIVSDHFASQRQRYIGLLSTISPIGFLVGPNIGGLFVQTMGWRSVFWLNVPLGVVVLLFTLWLIEADERKTVSGVIDFTGAGMMACFVTAFMFSLTMFGQTPWPWIVGVTAIGVVCLIWFIHRSKNRENAIIDLELLGHRPFLAANVYNFAFGASGIGQLAFMPFFAVTIYGMDTIGSGLALTPRSIGQVVASVISSFLITRLGYRKPIIFGTVIIAAGMVLLSFKLGPLALGNFIIDPVVWLLTCSFILGIGSGVVGPPANNACIELMPDKVASITGLRQMCRQIGGAVTIAVGTLILQYSPTMARGFVIVYWGMGVLMILMIPAIFALPRSPGNW